MLLHLPDKTSSGRESKETGVRKQIEIQSACQWDKDRKRVIETLCRRMNQGKLTRRFSIGPYYICPLAKISIQKPSGSLITYRVSLWWDGLPSRLMHILHLNDLIWHPTRSGKPKHTSLLIGRVEIRIQSVVHGDIVSTQMHQVWISFCT